MTRQEGEGLVPRDQGNQGRRKRRRDSTDGIKISSVRITVPRNALEFVGAEEHIISEEEVPEVVREIEQGMDLVETHTRSLVIRRESFFLDPAKIKDVTVVISRRHIPLPALGDGRERKQKKRKK